MDDPPYADDHHHHGQALDPALHHHHHHLEPFALQDDLHAGGHHALLAGADPYASAAAAADPHAQAYAPAPAAYLPPLPPAPPPLPAHPPVARQRRPLSPALQAPAPAARRAYKARCKWPAEDKLAVVQALVQQRALGQQAGGGFTLSAWHAVADALEGSELRSGGDVKGPEECRSAYSRLKREYVRVKQLRNHFAWDDVLGRPAMDDLAKRDFLRDHPAYTSVFSGWPYVGEMDTINGELQAVAAAIAKPLQVAIAGGSGGARGKCAGEDEMDDGASLSDSSDGHHARPAAGAAGHRHSRRSSSHPSPDLGTASSSRTAKRARTSASSSSAAGRPGPAAASGWGSTAVDPSLEHFALSSSQAVPPLRSSSSSSGPAPAVDSRHAARTLLWEDMLSDKWPLDDHAIIVILQRFDESPVNAATYADIPALRLRVLYLKRLVARDSASSVAGGGAGEGSGVGVGEEQGEVVADDNDAGGREERPPSPRLD